ncbi:uncharacterized protein K460DRAFT_352746 [Cucurbitaria berberidis CBS 394.84]|uniref:Uncharacterized protein n=1 Tax=Cucurbitaria berberidis CBS 394.84 TaxID=1168544 RepID=A0A9P4GLZ9_9PLEO|nr:uncharacterized protein K460DRAFT_352746 [Cucurbitaria berberidis CBS 394.84]KAF1847644.1 hypothetical protein K460DRAFT_352746 [Cucurbitaria berberidis CBS 394.84]
MARLSFILLALARLFGQSKAQCPNLVAQFNPNARTMSSNNTWFILPVPKTAVQKAIDEAYLGNAITKQLKLLDPPDELVLGDGTHPVIVAAGYSSDIRQSILQIDGTLNMLGAQIIVPFVGKDVSKTPLNAPLVIYLGVTDAALFRRLAAIIPAAVSTLVGGLAVRLGNSLPSNAAYQSDNDGLFSSNTKWQIVGNPFSGLGVIIEALDLHFTTNPTPPAAPSFKTLKSVINQPYLLKGPTGSATGKCQRNTYFFNNATAQVVFRSGRVILGPAASGDGITSGVVSGTLQQASKDKAGTYDAFKIIK